MKWGKTDAARWKEILAEAEEAAKWKPFYPVIPTKLMDGTVAWLEWIECRELYCIEYGCYIASFNKVEYRAKP